MAEDSRVQRTIVYYASQEALGTMTDVILSRLGYQLVPPDGFERLLADEPTRRPDLLLIDERRLAELPDSPTQRVSKEVPIVLLTGTRGASGDDPRVVGAIKRPAGMHDLYRLMQQVFEDTPRSTPRVATQLRARCLQGDRDWDGRVLSLSENGCLIRSPEDIPLGQRIRLELALPLTGALSVEAEATYQLLPDVGLVFNSMAPEQRETLERFVSHALSAG